MKNVLGRHMARQLIYLSRARQRGGGWGGAGGTAPPGHMLQGFLFSLRQPPTSPGEPRSFGTERSEFRDEAGDLQEPERRQNQRAAGFMGLKVRQGWRLREAQGEGSKVNLSV